MSKRPVTDYSLWLPEATALGQADDPLDVPFEVALREASQVAAFVVTYWEPTEVRPGLKRVKARLARGVADEIVSLVRAIQEAQTQLLLLVDPVVVDHGERARFVVDALESALGFLLDDGVEEPADAALAKIQQFDSQDGHRSSVLVKRLRDYAALAESLRDRLLEVDDAFDPTLIPEAKRLADALAQRPLSVAPSASAVSDATRTRNQLLTLLTTRVRLVRKAAAHVFQECPSIAREVTSGYERRRSIAARRILAAEEARERRGP
jgi:hypothetical protein